MNKPGPTGEFPDGKINFDDEGEIVIACGSYEGNVVIEFGSPIKWIVMSPDQARELMNSISKAIKNVSH